MIGLQSGIKVTVIRNAAGAQIGSTQAGCRDSAPTYSLAGRCSLQLPSSCGANTENVYDPSQPRKVINVMNFFDAPSSDFVPFYRSDLENSLHLDCELQNGDEIVCIWKPLLALKPQILVNSITPFSNSAVKVTPIAPPVEPAVPQDIGEPVEPDPLMSDTPRVARKRPPKTDWLPTYGFFFKPPEQE